MPNLNDPVIVRSRDQGCVFGLYQGHAGREVILKNARQIWSWQSDRLTLIDVGQTKATAENVRLSQACDELVMLEACGVISCTAAAAKSLASLPAATSN